MPSVNEAIRATSALTGYRLSAPLVTQPRPVPPTDDREERNSMIRCPLPVLWQSTPDSLRQFNVKGQVPQFRIMTPVAPTTTGTSTSTTTATTVSITGSGSGSSFSSSGSATISAAQGVLATPVLPPGNKFVGGIGLPKSFQLLSVAVSGAARVQFYGTATAQSQDLPRGLDAAPGAGTAQNIICDLALDTAPYQWSFQNRIGANADSPQSATIYATITNLAKTSATVTVTVLYVPLES